VLARIEKEMFFFFFFFVTMQNFTVRNLRIHLRIQGKVGNLMDDVHAGGFGVVGGRGRVGGTARTGLGLVELGKSFPNSTNLTSSGQKVGHVFVWALKK